MKSLYMEQTVQTLLFNLTTFTAATAYLPRDDCKQLVLKHFPTNMNRFYAIVLLALVAITATSASYTSVNPCEGVSDEIFVADITNCSNYYLCNNGQPIAQQCRDNLYFNAASQACIASSSHCLTCNKDVLNSTALIKTCNKYVLCFAGTPVLQQCADNLQYNPNLRACDMPTNVDCVTDRCSIYQNPKKIVYVASIATCNKYYICMNGLPQNQTCISGLYFSSACNCCDLPSKVNCTISNPRSRSVPLQTAAMIAPRMVDINCPTEGIHFLVHHNPNQYFMCVNGKGALMTCAASLYFDKEVGACRRLEDIQKKH